MGPAMYVFRLDFAPVHTAKVFKKLAVLVCQCCYGMVAQMADAQHMA